MYGVLRQTLRLSQFPLLLHLLHHYLLRLPPLIYSWLLSLVVIIFFSCLDDYLLFRLVALLLSSSDSSVYDSLLSDINVLISSLDFLVSSLSLPPLFLLGLITVCVVDVEDAMAFWVCLAITGNIYLDIFI